MLGSMQAEKNGSEQSQVYAPLSQSLKVYLKLNIIYLQHHITAFSANKFKNHCIQDRDVLQHCKGAKNCSLMLQQLQAMELLEIPGDGTFHAGHPSGCLLCCLGLLMHLQVYTSVFRVRPVNFPLNGMFLPQISIMTNQTAHKSSLYEGLICHGVCTNSQARTR